jgi:hypothetical protein
MPDSQPSWMLKPPAAAGMPVRYDSTYECSSPLVKYRGIWMAITGLCHAPRTMIRTATQRQE